MYPLSSPPLQASSLSACPGHGATHGTGRAAGAGAGAGAEVMVRLAGGTSHPSMPEASWSRPRMLSACLLLACRRGLAHEAAPIANALARELGDERAVKALMAVGALLGGDASVGRAELAREQFSGEADAATLLFAMVDRLGGGQHQWRPLVERVLATSSDPTWRAIAYVIAQLD
ncbi:hypothetical protein [Roseateles amylovorans]|uniref:HEAT repeat domain-containing protein n=1 Tax=Roseateles amylovorans TaxID=2978473 RepID=A0ABY6B7X5_9BURK|nr:hypothetical protein [Roseateles amylovorans]UXH80453.1 hypothetical protein N4261_11505 [Roseateles amylovorans]